MEIYSIICAFIKEKPMVNLLNNNNNDHSIYSTKDQLRLKGLLKFEFISLYGRLLMNKKPKLSNGNNLLHLGCGSSKFDGWINADFYSDIKFWKK